MGNWNNESEAREQIKALVTEYYHNFKENKSDFKPGDRISYASRVFDEKEIAGYRDILNEIHNNYSDIEINKNYILRIHELLFKYSSIWLSIHLRISPCSR